MMDYMYSWNCGEHFMLLVFLCSLILKTKVDESRLSSVEIELSVIDWSSKPRMYRLVDGPNKSA